MPRTTQALLPVRLGLLAASLRAETPNDLSHTSLVEARRLHESHVAILIFRFTASAARRACRPLLLGCLACLAAILPACAAGADEAPTEYQVKAAFLYKFAKFVEWPPRTFSDAADPLVVGVLGSNPIGDALEQIFKTHRVAGRRVMVKRAASLQQLPDCHIIFISASENLRLPQILQNLEHTAVLTIGDSSNFSGFGGVIGFTMDDSRVRFQINVDAAAREGLKVSSKLLNLATIVHDAPPAAAR